MRVVSAEPWRAADWAACAENRESADWDRIFAGYESTVGAPGAVFWRELVEAYPEAKVVLTVRDPQAWYDSAAHTISPSLSPPFWVRLLTWRRESGPDPLDDIQRLTSEHEYGGEFSDREQAVSAFEQHVAAVRAYVPADRLLVFDVREGWGPLCEFLGVPEPAEPFPRENDRATFRRRQRAAVLRSIAVRTTAATLALAGAGLAIWAVRRRTAR
jgi:Sulfotransferase domain